MGAEDSALTIASFKEDRLKPTCWQGKHPAVRAQPWAVPLPWWRRCPSDGVLLVKRCAAHPAGPCAMQLDTKRGGCVALRGAIPLSEDHACLFLQSQSNLDTGSESARLCSGAMNAGAKGGRNSAIVLDDSDEEGASKVERQPSPISAPASSSSMHVLGDRAQMERERLERQKKRRRDAGLLDEESDPMTTEKPSKVGRQHVEGNHGQSSVDGKGKQSVPLYWNGTIKVRLLGAHMRLTTPKC